MRLGRHNDWRSGKAAMRDQMRLSVAIAWLMAGIGVYAFLLLWLVRRFGMQAGLIASLLAAPFIVVALVPALLALFPAYVRWLDERTWRRWQGRYYAFDDRQIRVVDVAGDPWFAATDVLAALDLPKSTSRFASWKQSEFAPLDELGVAGLSTMGVARLVASRTDRHALRFLHWVERDVVLPWQRRRAAKVPFR